MSTHQPNTPYAAIHSVCVHPDHRGKGIALTLLKAYLARLSDIPAIEGARLITHDELIPLYQKAAFELVGPSSVVHGARKWYEMKVDFGGVSGVEALRQKGESQASSGVASPVAGGVATTGDALAAGASGREGEVEKYDEKVVETGVESEDEGEVRNPGKKWSSFGGTVDGLVDQDGLNKAGLYCPQAGCRCLLLRPGAGKWVRPTDKDFNVRFRSTLLCQDRTATPPGSPPVPQADILSLIANPAAAAAPPDRQVPTVLFGVGLLVGPLAALVRKHRLLAQRGAPLARAGRERPGGGDQIPHLRRLRPRPVGVA